MIFLGIKQYLNIIINNDILQNNKVHLLILSHYKVRTKGILAHRIDRNLLSNRSRSRQKPDLQSSSSSLSVYATSPPLDSSVDISNFPTARKDQT